MRSIIFLLGAFFVDYITSAEIQHGNYLLDVEDGVLRSIKPTGDSIYIDLSGLKLQNIEEKAFDMVSGVKNLNLSSNELTELSPSVFLKLTQLVTLSLADNKLFHLEGNTFTGLDKLESLNISNNSLRHLQKGVFYGLTKSVDIIAEGNDLFSISTEIFANPADQGPITDEVETPGRTDLPEEQTTTVIPPVLDSNVQVKICKTSDGTVKSVEELKKDEALGDCAKAVVNHENRKLDLSGLGVRKFEKGWYKVSTFPFAMIDLSHNDITEIPPELLNDLPAGLTSVNLGNNKIEIISKNVIENHHLDTLIFVNNFISTIEDGALEKTRLINIAISENRLKSLAFAKTLPSTLQVLTAHKNVIADIPEDSMKNLKDLLYINLSNNNVTHLSANTLKGLKKTQAINLSHNQLSEIHPGTFEDQEKLVDLWLDYNQITNINPGSFRGLKVVKLINLACNKIKKISKDSFPGSNESLGYSIFLLDNEIDTLEEGSFADTAILHLYLGMNKISTIPEGAFDTPTLTHLRLDDNLFTMIDGDSFAGLPNLHNLHMEKNKITSIKKGAVKNLRNLMNLDISNNPIQHLENGALYGFRTNRGASVTTIDTPIKVIQGGVFEDI